MALETQLVNELNKSFYNNVYEQFSRTRTKHWEGWKPLLPHFSSGCSVADIGCGDGRFLSFLEGNNIGCDYEGYDISSQLLKLATVSYPKCVFYEQDVSQVPINRNYDIVTAFGIMHHLPNSNEQKMFLNNLTPFINSNGYLIITFWLFNLKKERLFNEKAREKGITLETNDYLLDWGGSGENLRFCHLYTQEEIDNIVEYLGTLEFELINHYTADKSNYYLIFKKVN